MCKFDSPLGMSGWNRGESDVWSGMEGGREGGKVGLCHLSMVKSC